MRFNYRQFIDRLKVSYWFVPVLMGALAILLARFILYLDTLIPNSVLATKDYIFSGTPDQARAIMVGILGTSLGTAGIVFSLLTVPFSVVVSQYGSRLLRIFMRDRTFQLVLGVFTTTIAYSLTVSLAIPPSIVETDTPQIATTIGLLLALATVASLIALIHHIGTSLQAPNLVAEAGAELREVVRFGATFAEKVQVHGDPAEAEAGLAKIEQEGFNIHATDTGYIQAIDPEGVSDLAHRYDLVIQFIRKPGDFIQPGVLIARAWSPGRFDHEELIEHIRRTYLLGNQRTPTQDVEYAVMQLAEIAVRAMSPAINDPYTARTCLHHIAAGLSLYISQGERMPFFFDRDGRLRLIYEPVTFNELLESAFGMLRRVGRENAEVLGAILTAIEQIAQKTQQLKARAELLEQVQLVEAENHASKSVDWDRERIHQRCTNLVELLSDNKNPGRMIANK